MFNVYKNGQKKINNKNLKKNIQTSNFSSIALTSA